MNWIMIKICDYPCNDKRQAELEEDNYMMELKANMNYHRPSRTQQQYYKDNTAKIKNIAKQYYINEKNTCKCGCVVLKRTLKGH